MKKILLGTTALVGLFAGSAFAQGPAVTVGGFLDFQAGAVDQDLDAAGPDSRDVKFQNDTEIHVKAEGKTDNGLTYGAVVELEADVSSDADSEGLNADKTYLFLESGFGRVELGSNTDAAEALRVDASSFARGTGGINGDYYDFVSTMPAGFIYQPHLPTAMAKGVEEDANKITYYTPRFSGFQFGVSYTPDQGDVGSAAGFTGKLGTDYEDVFNLGLNYAAQYDQIGIQAAVTGEFAENESAAVEDLNAWNIGAVLSYAGFSFGGSYGDWQESGQLTAISEDSDYWTLGVGYETGPFGASFTFMQSDFAGNELNLYSLGADYQAAPGLVPYVEVNFFEADTGAAATDNDGTVVLAGAQLNF